MSAAVLVGTSGWRYPLWRGTFYPKWLPHRGELEYLSRLLNSVEINGSFYSLQRPELHGEIELYASGYTDQALDAWAGTIDRWRGAGYDVYVYFDNDAKVKAPGDAIALARRLGIERRPPR